MVRNCIHFSLIDEHTVLCASPKIIHSGGVPISICMMCPLAETSVSTQVPADAVAACKQCEEADSLPREQRDTTWCAVITTAPRPQATIRKTIASVWPMGLEPVVFAEPGSLPTNAKTVANQQRLGVWDNWRQAAQWALDNTMADKILTLQDDVAIHPQTKRLLDPLLWPSGNTGFVSLYTPAHYHRKSDNGLHRVRTSALWGACALMWPRDVLADVLQHPRTASWLGASPRSGNSEQVFESRRQNRAMIQNSDTAIGHIMNAMKKEMWFVTPSPAVHVAETSSIRHGGNRGKRNCGRCVDMKQPLASQLMLQPRQLTGSAEYMAAVETLKEQGAAITFAISGDMWDRIRGMVQPGMRTREFGSGVSTLAFSDAEHVAYEQDPKRAKLLSGAVFAPLGRSRFYRRIEWEQPPQILLIDGPHSGNRAAAYPYAVATLAAGGTVFVDDINRPENANLCHKLRKAGGTIEEHRTHDKHWCMIN